VVSIIKGIYDLSPKMVPKFDLLMNMIHSDPVDRISATGALSHPYFK